MDEWNDWWTNEGHCFNPLSASRQGIKMLNETVTVVADTSSTRVVPEIRKRYGLVQSNFTCELSHYFFVTMQF